ncbi:MAG: penicillin-binding protein 2 [Halobacteriovoraceae bacterium]|nr:penicillin-binding protein 2 [Halobacteriovoraceae bacterium]|tara:strand:- start:8828 stop:10846 length:2019 start_codon:yes stop_codon:yes gene_type:complete
MFGDEELIKLHRDRSIQVANIILCCFGIIFIRLWYLQIFKGELYEQFSNQNRLRKEFIQAPRGMMFDRNDTLLVDNIPRFDAILTRQYLKDRDKTIKRLSEILEMDVETINKTIKKYSTQAKYRPIIIKKNISHEEVAKIETENESLPGISVNTFISREYIDKEVGAHVLGYISEISQQQLPKYRKRDDIDYRLGDFIGQFGIEQRMDRQLRGVNGFEYVEVDALGRKKRNTGLFKEIEDQPEKQGHNLKLTIDRDMQKAAYEAMKGSSGSLVALDVNTGEILTMVSTPAFDPSQFSRGISSDYWNSLINNTEKPLRARSIQNHFPPGSTFKPFTAIAALEEGVINKSTKLRCHGAFRFGRRTYRSWKSYGTEKVDVSDALMQSCNIFFYKVAADPKFDIDMLAKYSQMFGFGKKTGVNLPREVSGLIPTKEWKLKTKGREWQKGETLSCSIGQSYVLVSTLQLANAYAAIATRGKLYKPYIVKEVFDQQNNLVFSNQPKLLNDIQLKDETWDLVQSGLYKVVNSPRGTAWWRRGAGNQMAGKTGTSQVIRAQSAEQLYAKCSEKEYKYRHHGVFVAFAPYDNPKIAVAALVEHGCGGSSAAAPVVEKVVNSYMKKYLPDLQEEYAQKEKSEYSRYIKARRRAEEERKQRELEEAEANTTEVIESDSGAGDQ